MALLIHSIAWNSGPSN
uniref:Uncharacterized protein n=1 Tax=Arundo donax TaxID=35708 RepID=A0A0A8Y0Z4_ARUDO